MLAADPEDFHLPWPAVRSAAARVSSYFRQQVAQNRP